MKRAKTRQDAGDTTMSGKIGEKPVNPFLAQTRDRASRGADDHLFAQALHWIGDRLSRAQKVCKDIEGAERGKRFAGPTADLIKPAWLGLEQEPSQGGDHIRPQRDDLEKSSVAVM